MKNLTQLLIASCVTLIGIASLCTPVHATPTFVGSYAVDGNGAAPSWPTNPLCYTPQGAAALLFGGDADDYFISTSESRDPTTITHTGWLDGWEESPTIFGETFDLQTGSGYNDPGGKGTAWSAYVLDHSATEVNYVWKSDLIDMAQPGDTDADDVPCDNNPAVTPEPASLALLGTGGIPLLGLLRKRRFV